MPASGCRPCADRHPTPFRDCLPKCILPISSVAGRDLHRARRERTSRRQGEAQVGGDGGCGSRESRCSRGWPATSTGACRRDNDVSCNGAVWTLEGSQRPDFCSLSAAACPSAPLCCPAPTCSGYPDSALTRPRFTPLPPAATCPATSARLCPALPTASRWGPLAPAWHQAAPAAILQRSSRTQRRHALALQCFLARPAMQHQPTPCLACPPTHTRLSPSPPWCRTPPATWGRP